MNKRARKKIERRAAFAPYTPNASVGGGALQYVPAGVQQSIYGQTFYGSTMKNSPTGTTPLFSPGQPLPTQPMVNPGGQPIQFRYPLSYNTFTPDRTLQQDDIPSFEQLRRLARLDYGINLCEQYWLDLVPRMTLDIVLRPEAIAAGAEAKNFQTEISYFRKFFSKPDREHNWHEWIQMALREQSQVDDIYIYKNRTRRGQLLGLRLVAADQMKPLLDDWGYTPTPPLYAYQQYPWGIPGAMYTTDQMLHKRGTTAVDDPYGMSRVERVILITNIALRKAKLDLAHFTENNIPSGMVEVPESVNWTPDEIDAYEQSWNALLAGNLQQMARIKFLQPGMKYTPFVQPAFDSVFDRYMLNIRASVYGVPMDELGFTDSSNRSVGESQEAMVYRRTIEPFARVYSSIFTDSMENDFELDLHGDMLMVKFGGYEEEEDEQLKATTLSTYTGAGILGISAAAKLAGLPEDPQAPQIGRMMMTQSGPIWLDDIASPEMRQAQAQATLAGYKMAANPPAPTESPNPGGDDEQKQPQKQSTKAAPDDDQPDEKQTMQRVADVLESVEGYLRLIRASSAALTPLVSRAGACGCDVCRGNDGRVMQSGDSIPPYHDGCDCKIVEQGEVHVERAQQDTEVAQGFFGDCRGGVIEDASSAAQRDPGEPGAQRDSGAEIDAFAAREVSAEYRRWRTRALDDVKAGKPIRAFSSVIIHEPIQRVISEELARCTTADDVRAVFDRSRERDASFFVPAASALTTGGSLPSNRSAWKLRW